MQGKSSTPFDVYVADAWKNLPGGIQDVEASLPGALALIADGDEIPELVRLAMHVLGERLGRWEDGVKYLLKIEGLPQHEANSEGGRAVNRALACLELASGLKTSLRGYNASDQIRILSACSVILSSHKKSERAWQMIGEIQQLFSTAGLPPDDPAHGELVICADRMARNLKEKPWRTEKDELLLLLVTQLSNRPL